MSERGHLAKPGLLELMRAAFDDLPLALLLVSADGGLMWHNQEAVIVCSVWNKRERGADALPLDRGLEIHLPPALWLECKSLFNAWARHGEIPKPRFVGETERGLYAEIRLLPPPAGGQQPACCLRLDYRRPRGDRHRPLSSEALALLARLSFREREVALRIRDGMPTHEIAQELRRSPLTIKTQLASVYCKLSVRGRSRVAVLLNR
jgi:DNA-binding CsgD family transcriptional regulator